MFYFILSLLLINVSSIHATEPRLRISPQEAQSIATKIYKNECSLKPSLIISWNDGEGFLSLGIGHFIWYPEGKSGPFESQFPAFIAFCLTQNVSVPVWLQKSASHCPWASKEAFQNQIGKPLVEELRDFLLKTQNTQAIFMTSRLEQSLPKIVAGNPNAKKISAQFLRVSQSPQGLYALIDYVNFKGDGTFASERYNGYGWGLLQVLEEMDNTANPLDDFAKAAKSLLTRRVKNAPKERNEQRWLQGWMNRIDTYTSGLYQKF